MVAFNQFSDKNASDPQRETPPEEILLSELVDTDSGDPMSDGLFDNADGSGQRLFKLRMPKYAGADVTGGDPDDDWYQAEVVGEEAVGGENPTPDQNVTEDLLRSMGLGTEEGESVHTHNKLETRDRQRWELDPESAEDYQERE